MEKEEFRRRLQYGYGRILLFLQDHDATLYKDSILENCLHNTTYDPQSEGSKVQYLYEIIQRTGEEPFYRAALLHAMHTIPEAVQQKEESVHYLLDDGFDWDASQLFDFGLLFAKQGDQEARQALYYMFVRRATRHCEFGADEIIELDGLEGFLFVAYHLHSLATSDEDKLTDWYLKIVEERFGSEAVRQFIEANMRANPQLNAYIHYPREKQSDSTGRRYGMDYEQIKQRMVTWAERIQHNDDAYFYPGIFGTWGRRASVEALLEAARDFLLLAADSPLMFPYLSIFRLRRFPLPFERLLALAESNDEHIADAAIGALEHISHASVRTLALHLAQVSPQKASVLGLFIHNYQDGDHVLIEELLMLQKDIDSIHSVSSDIFDIFAKNPTPMCATSLLYIYEHGPCVRCREKAVKLLLLNHVLPVSVAQECLYDSNFEIREMVAASIHN